MLPKTEEILTKFRVLNQSEFKETATDFKPFDGGKVGAYGEFDELSEVYALMKTLSISLDQQIFRGYYQNSFSIPIEPIKIIEEEVTNLKANIAVLTRLNEKYEGKVLPVIATLNNYKKTADTLSYALNLQEIKTELEGIEKNNLQSTQSNGSKMNDSYQTDVERLKNLMTSAATDLAIDVEHEIEYKQLRQSLLNLEKFKKNAPKFVSTCSSLKEFKREMQAISQPYTGRREHIKTEFYALINSLYGAETMADAISDIVQQVDFGQLNLLPRDIQEKGREMSDVYLYLYCIENSLRIFIAEVMKTESIKFPAKVQDTINKMKESEKESKYLPVRGDNDLFYCDFIQLGKIVVGNWNIFGRFFPNQNEHWLNVMMEELYKIRCLVAHNSFVGDHERQSLKVYYKNITMQLKL